MLLMLENFDNADEQPYIDGTVTLTSGAGKGGSNAATSLTTSNKIYFTPSLRAVIGFYTKTYTTGIVYFGYGSGAESFRVTISKSSGGELTISFYNPQQTVIENYPAISNQTAYQDTDTGYSLIEIYLDLEDATAHEGDLKIAIDGIEYVNLSDIVNAPINLYDDGLNSEQANYAWVAFSGFTSIDSLYICNEGKGFNDDFFGPFDIATLAPTIDGDYSNWERREYSEPVEDSDDRGNSEFIDKIPFDPDDAEYLNLISNQTLTDDLYCFSADDVPGAGDVLALEHRVWYKGLTTDQLDNLCVLTPLAKASGRDITMESEYEGAAEPFAFQALRTPYDVTPSTATAWTRENLDNTQFGYRYYETEQESCIADAVITATGITSGVVANLTDGDTGTSLNSTEVVLTFDTPIKLWKIDMAVQHIYSVTSAIMIDSDGNEYSMDAPEETGTETILYNPTDSWLKDISQIKIATSASYYVTSIDVFNWQKVGA